MVFRQQKYSVNFQHSFTLLLYCPYLCCHFYFYNMCSFWVEANLCRCFSICSYMRCRWRSNYQEGRVGIPLTSLPLQQFCTWPTKGPGFPTSCHGLFFMFKELRWDGVVCFVAISRIVEHLFLFIFIMH